jgi:membrane protein YqaA with SNARE-associated domain
MKSPIGRDLPLTCKSVPDTRSFHEQIGLMDFGQELVVSRFPERVRSESWQFGSDWLQSYGLFALMLIAGSPMPQTPALLFYSLVSPSLPGVLVAVGIGKTVKYVFLAWTTYRCPARFLEYR